MPRLTLTLFVTGRTPSSEIAIGNLRRICDDRLKSVCEIRIVDVLENPQLAEERRILATPTLIRESPLPVRRLIGDLSDTDRVFRALDLHRMIDTESKELSDAAG
jgi:circadian clock protein KaiB